jgi:hypothetical protein
MTHRIDRNAKSDSLPASYDAVLVSEEPAEFRRNVKGHAPSVASIPLAPPGAWIGCG